MWGETAVGECVFSSIFLFASVQISVCVTFPGVRAFEVVECSEDNKMDLVYGNVDSKCSKYPGKETDVCDRTGQKPASRETLKFLLAALGLLLLCAVGGLCVLGVLYSTKGVSYEALSEQNSSAVERPSVQEHNSSELKSHLTEVQLKYEDALKRLDSFREKERKFEELKVKYHKAYEFVSSCECQKCAVCGEGWGSFGLKCYYFSTVELNWMKSRDHCAEKGGHLVVITSQAEQSFVSSDIGQTHWIGLNDLENEGKWMWVNNQTLTETGVEFWFEKDKSAVQPDNWTNDDPTGEDCAALGDEKGNKDTWFDASCSKLKKYICEK